jgi:murein DD-endopeptidase MepM/ murein hydrolase activator NlpD
VTRVAAALLIGAAGVAASLVATIAGAAPPAKSATDATAAAVRVIVPGQPTVSGAEVVGPPGASTEVTGFSYPDDGSILRVGSASGTATTQPGAAASAEAITSTVAVTLFGGEITIGAATAKAAGSTHGRAASGDLSRSSVSGLTVLGQPAAAGPNGRVTLADWGYLITLEQGTDTSSGPGGAQTYHGFVTAIDVHLSAAHGGLPAGSEIQIGYAEVTVQAPPPPKQKPVPPRSSGHKRGKNPRAPEPSRKHPGGPAPLRPVPPNLQPKLTAGGYVFPVYGPVSFTDTFGAFRGDVPGNWHHGDDIFAPLGAPVLACADGIVFSVGWNDVGGNRFWLRDSEGNEFYYAHLSAFSPLAKNGQPVKAGEVLGFVGNTGDAAGTPTHLHFEIHPASLIFLGYDGAVDPTPYLKAWQHLQDVRFQNVAGWVPIGAVSDPAPKPAAILLQVSDISEASGLDPGSLQRAIAPRIPGEGDQALLRALGFRPPRSAGSDRG